MTFARLQPLALTAAFAALVPSAVALAQDADRDGVADGADALPCDGARAALSYYPAQGAHALLVFEDQWPGTTDLDFNDVAVRVHYRAERDAAGRVVELHAVIDPVAVGGEYSNGLALALPVPRAGTTVQRRIGGGAWQPVALEADAQATFVVSADLRELYGDLDGRINSLPGVARVDGQRLELRIGFAQPVTLSMAAAPYDVFIFRSSNFSHQIHFPQYAGTAAMNGALFNSDEDGSTPGRHFVHVSGIPAALNLMTTTHYPLEGVDVSALFPDIVGFAASGGTTNAGFYATQVVSANGHDIAAPTVPDVTRDLECMGTLASTADRLAITALPTLSAARTVVLSNTAQVPLTLTSVTLEGTGASRFSLSGCAAATVLPSGGGSCTLTVTFTPGAGEPAADVAATITVRHDGRNDPQRITLSGDSRYTPATPSGVSGATPPSVSGFTVTWPTGASYGGYTVGNSMRNAGRFAVSFTGSAAHLGEMEYNIQTETGGVYYGVSFPSGRVVRGGPDIVAGSANGATFPRPTLANNDRILMVLDYGARNVSWHHCPASTGVCGAAFHAVNGIVPSNRSLRVYSYKTGTGGATITLRTTAIPGMPASASNVHNGMPL